MLSLRQTNNHIPLPIRLLNALSIPGRGWDNLREVKMKAIIIEEERFKEILELMKLESYKLKESNEAERLGIDKSIWEEAIRAVHRNMHYYFVRWAQSHGASCT
jgi:hypothetical protein